MRKLNNKIQEEQKRLSGLVENISKQLEHEISHFLHFVSTSQDPIQAITSEKGSWILSTPFLKTEELLNSLVRMISYTLFDTSQEDFFVTSAVVTKQKELILQFGTHESPILVEWEVFANSVTVPDWEEVFEGREVRESLLMELEGKEKLLNETELIVKNPDALLSHGNFNLYLRRMFLRKKYNQDVGELISDLHGEVNHTKEELYLIKQRDFKKIESEEIINCLDKLQLAFIRFPKIESYKNYLKFKKYE